MSDYYQESAPGVDEKQVKSLINESLGSPIEYPPGLRAYIEDIIRQFTGTKLSAGALSQIYPTGRYAVLAKDLTAETGLYVWEDTSGAWLYCNGATLTSEYQALIDFLGTSTLPDVRGRTLWMTGTNANTDLFDNDGVGESSRQPKHTHTDDISISGTVSGTFASSSHTHSGTTDSDGGESGFAPVASGTPATIADPSHTHPFTTGAPSGTTSVSENLGIQGSVGSGMNGSDAVAHMVVGSLLIRP